MKWKTKGRLKRANELWWKPDFHSSRKIVRQSSTYCLIFRRKRVPSRPSRRRWSYVSATYIIGRISIYRIRIQMKEKWQWMWHTLPLTTTGRSNIPCMPRMAVWGGLIIGVPNNDWNTPPLLIVNVPPSISSMDREPFLAWENHEEFPFCSRKEKLV